jgi:hypothetical protein
MNDPENEDYYTGIDTTLSISILHTIYHVYEYM